MGVGKTNADLAVVPSDIIYDRGRLTEYDLRFWPIYNTDSLSREGAPCCGPSLCRRPGNHDTEERDFERYPDATNFFLLESAPHGPARKREVRPSLRCRMEGNKNVFSAPRAKAFRPWRIFPSTMAMRTG